MFAAENGLSGDPRLQGIYEAIRVVPNFPKPGIMFQDITSLVSNHRVFKDTIDILVDRYKNMGISVVAGVEARGFIFAPAIALEIGAKFIPLRKAGKLPERAGAEVVECACIIGLPEVEGRNRLDGKPVYILVEPRQQNYVV
ncbi:adenine phosphoribosyltransferase 5-like isoform X6 [Salvia miltiorrhiza]|nr:adenine phosphoribosyltransferase 5-like isoform X5 [Salvia miltiorrhiza]XP_057786901.1 adenine phosphoribosyltransferase 5-like isoform X6 [Salvia miltiorrhiza]